MNINSQLIDRKMELSDTTSIVCEGQPTQEDCTSQSMPSVAESKRQVMERSEKSFHSNGAKNTDERQIVPEEKAASPMLTSEVLPVIGVPPMPIGGRRSMGVSGSSTVSL